MVVTASRHEPTTAPVLEVHDLRVRFGSDAIALDGVELTVAAGESVGIVGESGCGKSTLARALMGLLPPEAHQVGGMVSLAGTDLGRASTAELRRLRGTVAAMIFQEPMSALNPLMSVGAQLIEGIRVHQRISRSAARTKAVELLAQVGISDPRRRLRQHPHELSGGMRQRVLIAMAISNGPRLLVADEPTTALDVTIQAQVLELLDELKRGLGMALVLISHDLGVMAECTDRLAVLYAGRVVESGPTRQVLARPHHPYTRGLLDSLPGVDDDRRVRLRAIPGQAVHRTTALRGCAFADRCPRVVDRCGTDPILTAAGPQRQVACWNPEEAVGD